MWFKAEKLLKAEGHYAGDLVSLDFKSESLHHFLENVVQLVNQHSQRINVLELDKMPTEEVRKGNVTLVNSAKLNPALAKEIAVNNISKTDTFPETIESFAANLSNHSNGTASLIQPCSSCSKTWRKPTKEFRRLLACWTPSIRRKTWRKQWERLA